LGFFDRHFEAHSKHYKIVKNLESPAISIITVAQKRFQAKSGVKEYICGCLDDCNDFGLNQ
jgi:hypothetical protein